MKKFQKKSMFNDVSMYAIKRALHLVGFSELILSIK